jgi:hypothetical protein
MLVLFRPPASGQSSRRTPLCWCSLPKFARWMTPPAGSCTHGPAVGQGKSRSWGGSGSYSPRCSSRRLGGGGSPPDISSDTSEGQATTTSPVSASKHQARTSRPPARTCRGESRASIAMRQIVGDLRGHRAPSASRRRASCTGSPRHFACAQRCAACELWNATEVFSAHRLCAETRWSE